MNVPMPMRLSSLDAARYARLRLRMLLSAPWAYSASPEDDKGLDLACTWEGVDYIDLGVSERADAARRLYESLGFATWGREPEATEVDGRRHDEVHMTLRL